MDAVCTRIVLYFTRTALGLMTSCFDGCSSSYRSIDDAIGATPPPRTSPVPLFSISHVSPNNGIIVQALVKPCVRTRITTAQSMDLINHSKKQKKFNGT
jgi:hypothetical protein